MNDYVFIAWSGLRSRQMAACLYDWIPRIKPGLRFWMSETDVPAGEMWVETLIERVKTAQAMIVCLTPENQDSRWLHFEAGLGMGKPLIPVLWGLDAGEVQAPLGSLNSCLADQRGMRKLVDRLSEVLSLSEVDREAFDRYWPDVLAEFKKIDELHEQTISPSGAYTGHLTSIGLTPWVALKYVSRLADPQIKKRFLDQSHASPHASLNLLRQFAVDEATSNDRLLLYRHIMWMFATHSSLDYLHYVWEGELKEASATIRSAGM